MNPTNIEYILDELFAGRATPLQKTVVEEWLRQPGNDEAYYGCLTRWETIHRQYDPDTASALLAFETFVQHQQPYPSRLPKHKETPRPQSLIRRLDSGWLWGVAASIALILLAWATQPRWAYRNYAVPYGQTRQLTLTDGTVVTLNAHSNLRIPRFGFGHADREVWLIGEGYFSVARLPQKRRFVVHTNALDVQVLGTKFNVDTRRGQTEVVLSEGKVELTAPRTRPLTMKPGESVVLADRDTLFRQLTLNPTLRISWQQRRLVFNETPMSQVARQIEEFYGVKVVLGSRDLGSRQLTGTLPNDDLNVVLKTLSVSYNLAVDRQKDVIVLR